MIIKVCDCFDAVTSDRPYRRPLSTDEGLDLVRRESGRTLDPKIADAFVRMILEQRSAIESLTSVES
jgi:HD-GYP domain-containing protein (c-di-GMP phosphodiesterase class II)